MPLPTLGALVVLGIGGLVLLVHLFGWTKRPQFADQAAAEATFLKDYPRATILATCLAEDRRAALFRLNDGMGFAAPFGDGRLTRRLAAGDLNRVEETASGLTLRLNDFTAPRLTIQLNGDAKTEWMQRLNALGGRA